MNDATRTLQNMLNTAALGWRRIDAPCGDFIIDAPLVLSFTRTTQFLDLFAYGLRIHSLLQAGEPVLTISVADGKIDVRDVRIFGLSIQGCGKEGHGIQIVGPDNSSWLYNFRLQDIVIEGVGGDGFNDQGSFFESFFDNCCLRSCGGWGATLGSQPQSQPNYGNMTGINWSRGSIRKNVRGGMNWINGTNDIAVDRTYFVENGGPALVAPNGIAELHRCQFENNQMNNPLGGPAILAGNWGVLRTCIAGANNGKQTGLIDCNLQSKLILDACNFGGVSRITGFGDVDLRGDAAGLTVAGPNLLKAA